MFHSTIRGATAEKMMPSKVEKLKQSLNGYAMGRNRVQLNDPGFFCCFEVQGMENYIFPPSLQHSLVLISPEIEEKKLKYHSVKNWLSSSALHPFVEGNEYFEKQRLMESKTCS